MIWFRVVWRPSPQKKNSDHQVVVVVILPGLQGLLFSKDCFFFVFCALRRVLGFFFFLKCQASYKSEAKADSVGVVKIELH